MKCFYVVFGIEALRIAKELFPFLVGLGRRYACDPSPFAQAAQLDAHELVQLGNPDALGLKVRRNGALGHLGDVTTDTAFFLGQA